MQIGHYTTSSNEVVSNLNMTSVETNDGGLYRCVAASKVGSAQHSARLNVYGLPFVRPMDKTAVVAGEWMIVTCPVAGHPIETIQWEKGALARYTVPVRWLTENGGHCRQNRPTGGRVLPVNRRQQVFPNGTLIVEKVQRQMDQGTYTCVAKNAEGFSSKGNLDVQVLGELQPLRSLRGFFVGARPLRSAASLWRMRPTGRRTPTKDAELMTHQLKRESDQQWARRSHRSSSTSRFTRATRSKSCATWPKATSPWPSVGRGTARRCAPIRPPASNCRASAARPVC